MYIQKPLQYINCYLILSPIGVLKNNVKSIATASLQSHFNAEYLREKLKAGCCSRMGDVINCITPLPPTVLI